MLTLNGQLADKVQELFVLSDDLANLLESSEIATVFLDTQLRIKRFTTTAARPFNLEPSDVGRLIGQISTNLDGIDLERECEAILGGAASLEREATALDGSKYLLRLFPYRRADRRITWGVVVTLLDVTRLMDTERELRAAREHAAGDLRRMTCLHQVTSRLAQGGGVRDLQDEIVKTAVEIAGSDMGTLQTCNDDGVLAITSQVGFDSAFLEYFARVNSHTDTACSAAMAARDRVVVEDITRSPYFGGGTLPVMLNAGIRSLQSTPLFDRSGAFVGMLSTHYRSVHRFGEAELKWLDLLARQAADLITHRQGHELLSRTNERLELRNAERMKWLTLLHQVTRAIQDAQTWDEAVRTALDLICGAERWQVGFVYIPDPTDANVIVPTVGCLRDERFRAFYVLSEGQRYTRRQNLPGLVYDDGIVRWVNDPEELMALMPLRAGRRQGRGIRIGRLDADHLRAAGHRGTGTVLRRAAYARPDARQPDGRHQRTNREDHRARADDGGNRRSRLARAAGAAAHAARHAGQTLTAVNVLSAALRHRLKTADDAAAATASQISQQATLALDQVRQLSRGMFPVDVDALDMMSALRELASATESIHKLRVQVEGDLRPSSSRVASSRTCTASRRRRSPTP